MATKGMFDPVIFDPVIFDCPIAGEAGVLKKPAVTLLGVKEFVMSVEADLKINPIPELVVEVATPISMQKQELLCPVESSLAIKSSQEIAETKSDITYQVAKKEHLISFLASLRKQVELFQMNATIKTLKQSIKKLKELKKKAKHVGEI